MTVDRLVTAMKIRIYAVSNESLIVSMSPRLTLSLAQLARETWAAYTSKLGALAFLEEASSAILTFGGGTGSEESLERKKNFSLCLQGRTCRKNDECRDTSA